MSQLAEVGDSRYASGMNMIRDAVEREMRRREWTVYRLWKEAKKYNERINNTQVYEFLDGRRDLTAPQIEALLAALELHVAPQPQPQAKGRPGK